MHGPAKRDEFGDYGSKEEMEKAFAAVDVFNEDLRAGGNWLFAGGLAEASIATVVDGRGETPVLTDGPYLESKEFIGGFWIRGRIRSISSDRTRDYPEVCDNEPLRRGRHSHGHPDAT